jgi:hypothetical protein
MCKFCDLELYNHMASIAGSLPYKDWPKEVKDYYNWMNELWDEGWKWEIDDNGNVLLIMHNDGGYDYTTLDCKFCPKCGRDMHEIALKYLNKKNEEEIDKALT